jgi:dTDP-4-amino-4,6-dideoxygalactose transaminase
MRNKLKLAINGGKPIRTKLFPAYITVGDEEKKAVCEVIDSGCLSKYLGTWHEHFNGGSQVQALEEEWAQYFGVKHAIAVNSCTSGLYCAVGSIGIEPGEEIIVSPYTMSASATAPLVYNALPIFADIEENFYCLDPDDVERKITSKTRAIIVVDIFGLPYNMVAINAIAKKHNLIVIEDAAQAPGAFLGDRAAGTLGDIGIYSLNYHKHIHSGEGGIIVTNNDELATKCRLIRNHAEAVVSGMNFHDLRNMIGFNYRMTEIEAAISRIQLKKLKSLNEKRFENVKYIEKKLSTIPCVKLPSVRDNSTHAYYVHPCRFDKTNENISRDTFINAVKAELPVHHLREKEGVKLGVGYVKPLYLQPIFQNKIAYGSHGYPFTMGNPDYSKGSCPIVERMHFEELFTHEFILPSMSPLDIDDVGDAFEKVWECRQELID